MQSAWTSSAGILVCCSRSSVIQVALGVTVSASVSQTLSVSVVQPWELDSSISPENREVIERMLLEEQYPFAVRKCTTRL